MAKAFNAGRGTLLAGAAGCAMLAAASGARAANADPALIEHGKYSDHRGRLPGLPYGARRQAVCGRAVYEHAVRPDFHAEHHA